MSEVQATLGDITPLVEQRYLRINLGVVGPVVTLGVLGLALLGKRGRGVTPRTATAQVALRDAIQMALARHYRVIDVASRYVRLEDSQGREHVLYVRVDGLPATARVAQLIRDHRATLQRSRGTLILYTLDASFYARQVAHRHDLQVWAAVQ